MNFTHSFMPAIEVPNWDDYFMTMAYLVAMKSKDESTHIGAVVVGPDKEVRSTGYNSFPRGLNDKLPSRQERPEKYFWFEHAERNAIYNATLAGVSLKGCKMYTTDVPCMDCARGIVQSGIVKVIIDEAQKEISMEKWADHQVRAVEMFKEVGVELDYWRGKIIDVVKYRHGKIIPLSA